MAGHVYRYVQTTGVLEVPGTSVSYRCYSGRGLFVNVAGADDLVGEGPIPVGGWMIRSAYNHPRLGPLVFPLVPVAGNTTKRSGFFIHGDNARRNQSASSGCIVAERWVREAIRSALAYRNLIEVVAR